MRVLSVSIVLVLVGMASLLWFGRARLSAPIGGPDAAQPTARTETAQLEPVGVVEAAPRTEIADTKRESEATRVSAPVSAPTAVGRCRIHGRVVSEDARPMADVDVSMYSVGGPWSTQEHLPLVDDGGRSHEALRAKTAADGTFAFTAPVPTSDWVAMSVTPSEYFSLGDRNFGPAGGRNEPRLVEGDNDLGDVALVRCGAIAGLVRSADGASLAGANVSSMSNPGRGRIANASVDVSGRFALGHLPPGQITFDVKKEGWISSVNHPAEVRVGETTLVDEVVLARAAEISGIVVDQEGSPAAKVRIWGWPQSSGQGAGTTTRDDGTFTVYLPQTEPYSFEINRAKEFEPWGGQRGAPEFTFEPGRKDVRIVLKRAALVTFRVVDAATRAPIESFGIAVDEKLAPGQYRSRFTRGVDPAEHAGGLAAMTASVAKHDVIVRAAGYAPFEGPIVLDPESKDTATVALVRASSMRGRLVRGGTPVAKADVSLQRESLKQDGTPCEMLGGMGSHLHFDVGDYAGRQRSVTTDDTGRFEFDELAGGTYALVVNGTDVAKKTMRAVVVPKSDVLDLGDVTLSRGAIVRGRLLTPAGISPVGFSVRMDGDWSRGSDVASADGSFEFTGLEAGQHVLDWNRPQQRTFSMSQRSPRAIDVALADGEVRELTIDTSLFGPSFARARVMRAGQPVPGLRVRGEVRAADGGNGRTYTDSATTDAEGWAEIEVEGGSRFDLVVLTADDGQVLATLSNLDAVTGARTEHTIEIHSGTLTLVLPDTLSAPRADWSLRLELARPGQRSCYAFANASKSPSALDKVRIWTGSVVELGEFPAGTYQATVSFFQLDANATDPRARRNVSLRESHSVSLTIEDGGAARLVVP